MTRKLGWIPHKSLFSYQSSAPNSENQRSYNYPSPNMPHFRETLCPHLWDRCGGAHVLQHGCRNVGTHCHLFSPIQPPLLWPCLFIENSLSLNKLILVPLICPSIPSPQFQLIPTWQAFPSQWPCQLPPSSITDSIQPHTPARVYANFFTLSTAPPSISIHSRLKLGLAMETWLQGNL